MTGPRVVHLLDPEFAGEGALCAAAAAQRVPGFVHQLWLIGGEHARAGARSLCSAIDRTACAPLGISELATRTVRRWTTEPGQRPDLIVAWSEAALGLAALAAPEIAAVGMMTSSPLRSWRGVAAEWLQRRALARTPIMTCGRGLRDAWTAAGASVTGEIALPGRVPASLRDRAAVRQELGLEPNEVAVLLLADPPTLGDAKRFAHLLGIMEVCGCPAVGLVGDSVTGWPRAARFVRRFGTDWPFIRFQGPWLDALAAADVVVWHAHKMPIHAAMPRFGGAPLALAALGAGRPVVTVDHPFTRAALSEIGEAHGLLAAGSVEHRLATVLRGWVGDPPRRAAFAEAGRAFAAQQQSVFEADFARALSTCVDRANNTAAAVRLGPAVFA